jgi:hypothetical protein
MPGEASNSSTKRGTPSDALPTRDCSSASAPGEQAAIISATSRSDRRPSGRCTMPALPRCRRARSDAGDGGSVRRETANRTGWPAALSARYSTRDTVSGSAQCRSSMATTSPSGPRRRSSRSTASPLTACESTPRSRRAAGPPATAPGSRAVRCGSHGASEGSSGSGRLRSSCSKASVTGRYGALAEAGTARPITTSTCRPAAIRASSRIRRDLPMPASPVMTAQPPWPASAPARADSSAWISARRPTRTGHSTSPTIPVCRIGASAGQ